MTSQTDTPPNSVLEAIADERKFLHDIATPFTTAIFLLDMLAGDQKKEGASAETLEQLTGMNKALEQIKLLLQNRRSNFIQRSEKK